MAAVAAKARATYRKHARFSRTNMAMVMLGGQGVRRSGPMRRCPMPVVIPKAQFGFLPRLCSIGGIVLVDGGISTVLWVDVYVLAKNPSKE